MRFWNLLRMCKRILYTTMLTCPAGARGLNFHLGLHLYIRTQVLYASSDSSGEHVHMRRLACAFAGRLCDKNPICWLMCVS